MPCVFLYAPKTRERERRERKSGCGMIMDSLAERGAFSSAGRSFSQRAMAVTLTDLFDNNNTHRPSERRRRGENRSFPSLFSRCSYLYARGSNSTDKRNIYYDSSACFLCRPSPSSPFYYRARISQRRPLTGRDGSKGAAWSGFYRSPGRWLGGQPPVRRVDSPERLRRLIVRYPVAYRRGGGPARADNIAYVSHN